MAKKSVTEITKKPTPTQEAILTAAQEHPDLTTREIGKLAGCSHVNVINTLHKYNIQLQDVNEYKQHRADILAGLQGRLLSSITEEDVKKASLLQRLSAYGIIYDKERLERGQSTANVQSLSLVVDAARARREQRLKSQVTPGSQGKSDSNAHNNVQSDVDAEVIE